MGGGCSFPIRAESREQAVQILQNCLGRFNAELAMEFPRVAGSAPSGPAVDLTTATDGLSGILLERIDTLMKALGGGELVDEAKAKTIKLWTELEFTPDNYASIVHELELFASGAKEIVAKPKKK